MNAHGTAHKYGDHVDTDVIIPARYLNTQSHEELAAHCMEDIDRDFPAKNRPGDIMVAGLNFGCGSSREHAPIAIKAAGVSCVIAKNFARIFYRNAINIGLPVIVCKDLHDHISSGDEMELSLTDGIVQTGGQEYVCTKLPPYMQEILDQGGLIASLNSICPDAELS